MNIPGLEEKLRKGECPKCGSKDHLTTKSMQMGINRTRLVNGQIAVVIRQVVCLSCRTLFDQYFHHTTTIVSPDND